MIRAMVNRNNDIRDDEFYVIGRRKSPAEVPLPTSRRRTRFGWILLAAALLLGLLVWLLWPRGETPPEINGVFDPSPTSPTPTVIAPKQLGIPADSLKAAFVEKVDTTINDVVLSIYIPRNTAAPILTIGAPDAEVRKATLAFQAADIRADNWEILGSFVQKGKVIARGRSKKGFCAIIDGKVTVGVAENSPLFEEAAEKDGYFFRQFSLVNNGVLEENALKNKTMRKALCDRGGQIFVAVSETSESMHDFAQALVDLGVDNAINLVGSSSAFGWYVDENGVQNYFGVDLHRESYRNENYIVWK